MSIQDNEFWTRFPQQCFIFLHLIFNSAVKFTPYYHAFPLYLSPTDHFKYEI